MAAIEDGSTKIKSFVLFDTETTGLPSPGNNPRITELCFLALTREELEIENGSVRAINKLCLCFNPKKRISCESIRIAGLHNDSLENLATFKVQASLVCEFLANLPQPVCLVAHNGRRFDFPLLVAHLKSSMQKVPDSVLCADSLEAFRTFDGLPPVPAYLQKGPMKTNKCLLTSATPAGAVCSTKEQVESNGICEENDEGNQNPNSGNMSSLLVKNEDIRGDKHADVDMSATDTTSTHWETQGLSTPAKKVPRIDPGTPTKRASPPLEPEGTTRHGGKVPRQNLLQTLSKLDSSDESQQTQPHFKIEVTNDCAKFQPNGASNDPANMLHSSEKDEPSSQGEKDAETEKSLKHQSLSSFPSLSDDSENLLLEAVEQAELAEKGEGNSTPQADSKKEATSDSDEAMPTANKTTNNFSASENGKDFSDNSPLKIPKVSYSLPKLYERIFGQQPLVSHTAEDDCQTLLQIIRNSAIHTFPQWCDQNAVPLKNILPMY